MVVVNGLTERGAKEREKSWNDFGRVVDGVSNEYKLYVLGDLNGWVGDIMSAVIIGAFKVAGENDDGRRVIDLCAERELCVGNAYFEHKSLHKYTRVARGQVRDEFAEERCMVAYKEKKGYISRHIYHRKKRGK